MLSSFSHVWLFVTLWMNCSPPGSSVNGILQDTGVDCHALFQGIFPIWDGTHVFYIFYIGRRVLYHKCHKGSQVTATQIQYGLLLTWLYLQRTCHVVIKSLPANAADVRDMVSIPRLGRFPGGGYGNPPQCSCLENPMDRGDWRSIVHSIAQSHTRLKWLSTHTFISSTLIWIIKLKSQHGLSKKMLAECRILSEERLRKWAC